MTMMQWDNWYYFYLEDNDYLKITDKQGEEINRQQYNQKEGEINLLVQDDGIDYRQDRGCFFKEIQEHCIKNFGLCNDQGETEPPTTNKVNIFFTNDYNLAQSVIHSRESYTLTLDGFVLDMKNDHTDVLDGYINLHRVRFSGRRFEPGILVVSSVTSIVDKVSNNSCSQRQFAIEKNNSYTGFSDSTKEAKILTGFFSYLEKTSYLRCHALSSEYEKIIGRNTLLNIADFLKFIEEDKDKQLPVLILGPQGTGKDQVARLIHYMDNRKLLENNSYRYDDLWNSYIPENVTSLSSGTWRGDLFGVMGVNEKLPEERQITGSIQRAENGTLFLDEIADTPIDMQMGLLRFLEQQEIRPVGTEQYHKVNNVRCVFATNKDMLALEQEGKMRPDFIDRLDGIVIRLADLKDREGEYAELVDYFLSEQVKKWQ